MLRLARRLSVAALFSASFVAPRIAHAGGTEVCIAASEQAQELRNAGKLVEARDQLVICSRAACPKLISADCTRWMGEVIEALPSVVPAAKDGNGRDVIEARFSIDGKPVTEALDGKPIAVDPGVHVFRFEAKGSEPQEERVAVRSGEQNRVVTVKLVAAAKAPLPTPNVAVTPPTAKRPIPILPITIGAVGVVLLGVALYMDLSATGAAHDLRNQCAPSCAEGKVDDIKTRYVVSGITAGVGVAALVVGGVLYFRARNSDVGFGISPRNDGAIAQGRISF